MDTQRTPIIFSSRAWRKFYAVWSNVAMGLLFLPGEIFVEIGLAIKQASPFENTIVTELANGSIGYVPDRKAYAEGNYEPVSARCAPGSGELLVETSLRLLRELKKI